MLKYETQHGPRSSQFPYYPAALEYEPIAKEAVLSLPPEVKRGLVLQWRSRFRLIDLTQEEAILSGYATVIVDEIIRRAELAGSRTIHW